VYAAAPTAANADGIPGFSEKLSSFNIPTIPNEITDAVAIEPITNFVKCELTGSFSTSLSMIICERLFKWFEPN
jgi:hypothetical protein